MFERIEESPTHLGQCAGTVPGDGRFRVFDHGAHVTEWSPSATPVIFTSSRAVYDAGTAIRGGIPVCFPWFGPGADGRHKPSHGPARLARWRLAKVFEQHDVTTLEWRLTADAIAGLPGADLAPRAFEVTYRQSFGRTLALDFRVRNTGEDSLAYEAALHTYFAVGDVEAIRVEGLSGAEYADKVIGGTDTQRGDVTFAGETDRVYASAETVTIHDPRLRRRITIAKEGSADTVVWNPGAEKATGLPDLGDTEWRGFVCVESANIGRGAVHLAAGESHVMRVRIDVGRQ